jgi:deoxyadenosine/deoxycytidine kinase
MNDFNKKIIVITGNMGTGKTTFGRSLAQKLNAHFIEELAFDTPLLEKFFSDPFQYCYDLQLYFIEKRIEILKSIESLKEKIIILDRSILDSRNAYLPVHLEMKHLNQSQYKQLIELIDDKRKNLPKANLMIFLDPGLEKTVEHIFRRDRFYERSLDFEYLAVLHCKYQNFYFDYNESPKMLLENFYNVDQFVPEILKFL